MVLGLIIQVHSKILKAMVYLNKPCYIYLNYRSTSVNEKNSSQSTLNNLYVL